MGLTSLSVLLAIIVLNIHLYGSTLKPVPRRLRHILFHHLAPLFYVQLHRDTKSNNRQISTCSAVKNAPRSNTIYNVVFLNDNDLVSNGQPTSSSHTLRSATINEDNINRNSSPIPDIRTVPQSLNECKRLLAELNRLILRPTETRDEDIIIHDWQNVALVVDRCLFLLYIVFTGLLTLGTLVLAPLFKSIPKPPNYYLLNVTSTN